MGTSYGYARVSSADQNEERQIVSLTASGVKRQNIIVEKFSGKDFNRPKYRRLIKKLREGDILFISSLDRLGRNYTEIQEQWRYIVTKKKVDIVVIDMPLLDTRQETNLLGTFIADLVLQILSFVAETERQHIKERQAQGIAAAKARGVKFGRPGKPLPENIEYFYKNVYEGNLSIRGGARKSGVSLSTFFNNYRIYKEKRQKLEIKSKNTDFDMIKYFHLMI